MKTKLSAEFFMITSTLFLTARLVSLFYFLLHFLFFFFNFMQLPKHTGYRIAIRFPATYFSEIRNRKLSRKRPPACRVRSRRVFMCMITRADIISDHCDRATISEFRESPRPLAHLAYLRISPVCFSSPFAKITPKLRRAGLVSAR